jgi:SpoVK/Ycf46/Vps4 family AAA+-type ATPase
MGVDPSVIAALRAALVGDPANAPLRRHLAATLLDAGDPAAALAECTEVLGRTPDDLEALGLAERAAAATGDEDRAASYGRLRRALGGGDADAPATAPSAAAPGGGEVAVPVGGAPSEELDEFDAFLQEVLSEDAASRVTLDDVGGLDDVKRRIRTSFLGPLQNPELRAMYGTTLRGGLLLYGPPGCGKTFLARAVAGELGARFLSIGLHEILDMWLGSSEKNLHAVFEEARRLAPCVLFFDEVDALGMKRSNLSGSAGRNVVAQLLAELDSLASDNEGLYVLGATNAPWDIDAALRRPGRFDRTMLVLPPDAPARRAILDYQLRDKPLGRVDLDDLAKRTDGWSGADLRLLCSSGAEHALLDSIERGTARPIEQADLRRALKEMKPSVRPWFETARNYAAFANQDGEYDDLLAYMRANRLA